MADAFEALAEARLAAVLRVHAPEHMAPAIRALREGGVRAIEVTFSSPCAADGLCAARREHGPDALLGAGTLRRVDDVAAAVAAGADFLVSPHLRPDLLDAMVTSGLPALPGAFTPTEVAAALDAGAQAVKLFPASIGGVAHMRALRGPFPGLRVVPTGGVSEENAREWLDAGALAVGVGGELCRTDLIEARRFDELAALAQRFVRAVEG